MKLAASDQLHAAKREYDAAVWRRDSVLKVLGRIEDEIKQAQQALDEAQRAVDDPAFRVGE